jgi:hypothetical protein
MSRTRRAPRIATGADTTKAPVLVPPTLARDLEDFPRMKPVVLAPKRPASLAVVLVAAALAAAACGAREPSTDAERLARGKEIIERMSTKLGSAAALTVTTREVREEPRLNGQTHTVTLARETAIRRPNRAYFKTSGDVQNEGWYDGVGLTLAMHGEKVFGQARMPETLDKTLDAMHERYGVAAPVADLLYSSPAKALLSETTTGGWVARETLDGQPADHLAFKDKGVSWEVWVAANGDPLPMKSHADFPDSTHLRRVEVVFSNWNLAPTIGDERFNPAVPADYEGIAILQRARVLRNMPKDEPAPDMK